MNCPICKSEGIINLVYQENIPVMQNAPLDTFDEAINVNRGQLNLCICEKCDFTFNEAFDETLITYNENYNNNQTNSEIFQQHMYRIMNKLELNENHKYKVLEVGCGKGDFLKKMSVKYPNSDFWGFDSTYVGETEYSDNLVFYKKYYDLEDSYLAPEIIVCRHVIEHIPNPKKFLLSIVEGQKSKNLKYYFETPDVEWIFNNNAFWDIFYEHCSYFSRHSLNYVFEKVGISVQSIKNVFNGQYLLLEAKDGEKFKSKPSLIKPALEFKRNYIESIEKWKKKLESMNGNVVIWGAGAKGVTFLNLIDPNRKYVKAAVDININKQNRFIPGTGHEIIGFERISDEIENIIVMNTNYIKEIEKMVKGKNIIVL